MSRSCIEAQDPGKTDLTHSAGQPSRILEPYRWIWMDLHIITLLPFKKCSILIPDIRKQPQTS